MEHHSNVVPWYQLARETGAHLDWAPIDGEGRLDLEAFDALLERGPKLVCVAHVSNVLGTINPVAEIARMAHDGRRALWSSTVRRRGRSCELDVAELGADFYAITGHKMYGPTGVGVLFGRRELLEEMPPFIGGGSMIRKVSKELITWADLPAKFEGGTPAIGEAIGFGGRCALARLSSACTPSTPPRLELTSYALERIAEVPGVHRLRAAAGRDRGGIVSFAMDGVHAHDVSEILDRHGVAVRAGHHCAQVLMERLGVPATTRASFAVYNTRDEVDRLIDGLRHPPCLRRRRTYERGRSEAERRPDHDGRALPRPDPRALQAAAQLRSPRRLRPRVR